MHKSFVLFSLAVSSATFASADDGALAVKTRDEQIVRLPSTPIIVYSQVQGFGKPKRTGQLPLSTDIPTIQPASFLFEQRNPEKGWGLKLVRLVEAKGKFEFYVKMGFSEMEATNESLPLGETAMPKPVKASDGTWSLALPKDLPKGHYAIVGFDDYYSASINGVSTKMLSFKHGIAWMFKVE